MTKINIGLFGFGCVGQGFHEILTDKNDPNFHIKKIVVKNENKPRSAPKELFSVDAEDIFNDGDINLIVELIDDAEKAFELVKRALVREIPVISANKKMIAAHLEELNEFQEKYNVPFLYEGAVCGSVPILQTLENYYQNDHIKEIRGIFNGSTNYILSKVLNENLSYESALKSAQELGFAETDPTLDVGGFDPSYKLAILIKHAFGISFNPNHVIRFGIDQLSTTLLDYAKANGLKVKLIARSAIKNGQLSAMVVPHLVSEADEEFSIENEFNSVTIKTEYSGNQLLVGKGAGKLPTGLAVYNDLKNLSKGFRYEYKESLASLSDDVFTVFIKYEHSNFIVKLFDQVIEHNLTKGDSYVIGKISPSKLKSLKSFDDLSVGVFSENAIKKALLSTSYSYAV
ncbi:homoserine dehydrogenase [Fulvivirga lutea]|uniref:Homoserine dehydrogenase n=1 Tax=Fulvivirga lutea TaxID=2810512 RepID=A0A975A1S7_9BACT|nr:homoserine dehydrogenase [Fulvivirga lutea]QSE98545.1 homoserine dehydrogenase [Fulvivirga lutea]